MGPFHQESITVGGDRAVLRIDGDIDACAAPQLRDRVMDLAGHGTVHLIADLRGVGFLDSAGLGALVGARKELRGRGGSLMLVAGTARIVQVLRITGLSDAFGCPFGGQAFRSVISVAIRRSSMTARPCSVMSDASRGSHGLTASEPVSGVDSPAASASR
jgi:anti-sigma B factor antagonist